MEHGDYGNEVKRWIREVMLNTSDWDRIGANLSIISFTKIYAKT
jgi:hypothetical protein